MDEKNKDDKPVSRALKREGFTPCESALDEQSALSALLDLQGSVRLAEFLDDVTQYPSEGLSVPLHPIDPKIVQKTARTASERILSKYDGAFTEAFRPYYRLPLGLRAHKLLTASGLLTAFKAPSPVRKRDVKKAKKTLLRTLWSPYDEFVQTQLKRARFGVMDLRSDVAHLLTQVSVFAGQLAQVDAALHNATKNSIDALVNGLAPAIEKRFALGLNDFDPTGPNPKKPDSAFGTDGWLAEIFLSYGRLARGVVEHELQQVAHLVEAATKGPPEAFNGREAAGSDVE